MTVRELKDMLNNMDDGFKLTMLTPEGNEKEITNASQQGNHFTFWADNVSY